LIGGAPVHARVQARESGHDLHSRHSEPVTQLALDLAILAAHNQNHYLHDHAHPTASHNVLTYTRVVNETILLMASVIIKLMHLIMHLLLPLVPPASLLHRIASPPTPITTTATGLTNPPSQPALLMEHTPSNTEVLDEAKERFQIELEFVQSLANPLYLRRMMNQELSPIDQWSLIQPYHQPDLAVERFFEDEALIEYLRYLKYWQTPEYVTFIVYVKGIHCVRACASSVVRR
jgi:hypothetical protein